jgi:hypothetical protein
MSKSDLTDLTLALHAETDKAVLVSETGDPKKSKWIPKSQCEIERTDKFCQQDNRIGTRKYSVVIVTLPEWLAINKELA